MDAIQSILTRRSVRKFKDEAVEKEKLDIILDCAKHSPTAMNKQNRQFTVLTKEEDIIRLAQAMKEALNRDKYDLFKAKAVILVTAPRDSVMNETDCSIALANIYIACHAIGLGSCWVNQLRDCQDDPNVRSVLSSFSIPEDHVSFGMSAIGYVDEKIIPIDRTEKIVYVD